MAAAISKLNPSRHGCASTASSRLERAANVVTLDDRLRE
jgi:hypothetical protein